MRMIRAGMMLAAASMSFVGAAQLSVPAMIDFEREAAPRPSKRRLGLTTAAPRKSRSRWKAARRKPRANRIHISRRVRRKHRRAA